MTNSRLPGFYKETPLQRRELICKETNIKEKHLFDSSALSLECASVMVENTIGTFALPLATAVNFQCNGKDVLIPMVIEEPSVVAALSNMAQLTRKSGGFFADSDKSIMIGQIQIPNVKDPQKIIDLLKKHQEELRHQADQIHTKLKERGGGLQGISFRHVIYDEPNEPRQDMVIVHFELDCVDAMGANMINTIAEYLAPRIEVIIKQPTALRILSNYATQRCSRAWCCIPVERLHKENILGIDVAKGIVDAYRFAYCDPWRATTHNKGVMNGIDAVVIATGNDWRAIEAGAHAWAARSGQYRSLTRWFLSDQKCVTWQDVQTRPSLTQEQMESPTTKSYLIGCIELPLQIGTVGGSIKNHPQVLSNLQMLGNPSARELSNYIAMVGLAQNLGALRALVTDGIQKGHMKMHARNVAFQAGAQSHEISDIVEQLSKEHVFTVDRAKELLQKYRNVDSKIQHSTS